MAFLTSEIELQHFLHRNLQLLLILHIYTSTARYKLWRFQNLHDYIPCAKKYGPRQSGHFYGGSSGCHPETKIIWMWPGYHMFFRKQYWNLVSELWVWLIQLVRNQCIISCCFEACCVQRFHLQEVCAKDWFYILPRMKKSLALFCISKIFQVMLHKKNFNMWVTSQAHSQKFLLGFFWRKYGPFLLQPISLGSVQELI